MLANQLVHRRRQRAGNSVWREGAEAGLAGAAVVAVWFFIYDLAIGMPFRTPTLLGAALFSSAHHASGVVTSPALVVKYSVVHVLAFLLFGWAAAGLFALADREPRFRYVLFLLFCCFQVVAFAFIAVIAAWLLEPLAWWLVLGANLAATAAMLAVFGRHHRVAFWREDVLPPA